MPKARPSVPLQQTLWEIERRWGQGALARASSLEAGARIPTGYPALDALLDRGGIAAGHLSAVVGAPLQSAQNGGANLPVWLPTTGATTLVYRLIAQAQARGDGLAAYVDLGGTFDAEYAAGCGVALDRLLIVVTRSPARGLNIALDAIRSEQVALVALDAAAGGPAGASNARQIDAEALERLRANVTRTRCALVLLTRGLRSPALTHTLLQVRHGGWVQDDETGVVRGVRARVDLLRDAGTERRQSITLAIDLPPLISASPTGASP